MNAKQKLSILFLVISISAFSQSDKQIKYNNQIWLGDFTKVKFNDKWSVYFDCGFRRTEWLNKWSQILLRPGIIYSINKNISITAGLAYFSHFTFSPVRPEYRGWEQLLFKEEYGRVSVSHRLRVEQRFNQRIVENRLIDDYNYNNRFRYQFNLQIALNKQTIGNRTFYLTFADEIMVNSGKEIKYNYFDQNRISGGLGYKLNDRLNVSIAYMNVFIQKNQANSFEQNNVVVLNLYHNFNLSKK